MTSVQTKRTFSKRVSMSWHSAQEPNKPDYSEKSKANKKIYGWLKWKLEIKMTTI